MSEPTVQSPHAKQTEIGTESELHNCEKKKKNKKFNTSSQLRIYTILSCHVRIEIKNQEGQKKNHLSPTLSSETNSRI